MRLIDADELLLNNTWLWYDENGNHTIAGEAIENAPTVDHVKHGHWIEVQRIHEKDHTAICECSLCGDTVWVYDGQRAWNYCPNCGAEMDEVKVNNSKGLDFWMNKEQFNEIYEVENETD